MAATAQFSQFQSDANCPNESILKQSQQILGSSLKYHQETTEHMHFVACSTERLQPPPPNLPSHLSTEASQNSEGKEDQCPASASSGKGIEQSALHLQCDIQHKQVSPQVCKCAFRFISLERPPGRSFWQLPCHTEEQMIHSCSFNVVLREVARQLDVTLKMFGP